MINLLPEEQNKEIKKERTYRVFLILIIYSLLFLLFFSGTLYFLNIFSKDILKKEKNLFLETELEFSNVKERENKILEINQMLPQVDSFYQETIRISDILEKIYKALPENAYIKNFRFIEKPEKIKNVAINGYAADIEDLLKIEDNLKNIFSNVEISPEAWIETNDINFTITLDI